MPNDLSKLLLSLHSVNIFKDLLWTEHFNRHLESNTWQYSRERESDQSCDMFSTRYDRDTKGSSGQFYHLSKVGTFVLGLETYLGIPQAGRKEDNKGMKAINRRVWGSSSSLLSEEHRVWVWAWQESVLREVGRGQSSHSTDLSRACILGLDRKSGKRWK